MMAFCAKELNENDEQYLALIETHGQAVRNTYLRDGSFCDGVQGADAFALDCGLGDESTLQMLVRKYRTLGEFDTGIFGTPILLRTLFENGYEDLAVDLLTNRKDGSFDAMRRGGATTLWENWNGEASHNHPMFGASTVYLFRYILGIRQADDTSGMRSLMIDPVFPKKLDHAEGSVTTPQGKIAVQWERRPEGIRIQIRLCPGTQAMLRAYGQERTLYAGENVIMIR
jgi:alpha-L-rhamnosidase